jgi:hypothetical protein
MKHIGAFLDKISYCHNRALQIFKLHVCRTARTQCFCHERHKSIDTLAILEFIAKLCAYY